jgi:hypothetical protein
MSVGLLFSMSLRSSEIPQFKKRQQIADSARLEVKSCAEKYSLRLSRPAVDVTAAYIFVEQLARSEWRQDVELMLARFAWALGVTSPARTLGLSQLSEDTFNQFAIRDWLSRFVSVEARLPPFWRLMADRCLSLLSAYRMIEVILDAKPTQPESLLRQLNGPSASSAAAQQSHYLYRFLFHEALSLFARKHDP